MPLSDVLQRNGRAIDVAVAAWATPLRGGSRACPLCGWSFRWFTRGKLSVRPKPSGYCPRCNSKPRHRWFRLHLDALLPSSRVDRLAVLHIAPAHSTYRVLSQLPLAAYVTAGRDRSRRLALRCDLEARAIKEASFDVVVCIHVLEHVDDDQLAMRTLFEVTKPGGIVAVGVPVNDTGSTIEDPAITDPAEREKAFGEPDHRRWYAADIVDRLRAAGFHDVDPLLTAQAPSAVRDRYGLTRGEGLFLCRR